MKKILILLVAMCMLLLIPGCDESIDFGPDTDERWGEAAAPEITPEPAPLTTSLPSAPAAPTETPLPTAAVESVTDMALTLDFVFGERAGTYTGEMVDGLPDGFGAFTFTNEEGLICSYEGQWIAGHENGPGTLTWSDGYMTTGTFVNDYMNGEGETWYYDNLYYKGGFLNGDNHGQGTLYNTYGEAIFSGTFSNGYIEETADARNTRISAFKDTCYEPTYDELYSDSENAEYTHVIVSGTVFSVIKDADQPYYGSFLMYDPDALYWDIVWVTYRMSVGEADVTEDQVVTVCGTPISLYTYAAEDGEEFTVPWVIAWGVE